MRVSLLQPLNNVTLLVGIQLVEQLSHLRLQDLRVVSTRTDGVSVVVIWHLALVGLLVLRPRHVSEGLLGVLAARLGVSSFGEHGGR